jgi:hypothetical protein
VWLRKTPFQSQSVHRQPLIGGLVAQWMRMEFIGLSFRDGFNLKPSIFTFAKLRGDPRLRV